MRVSHAETLCRVISHDGPCLDGSPDEPCPQVLFGSIFDLLVAQCDRHGLNIFIDHLGQMQYIDNESQMRVEVSSAGCLAVWLARRRRKSLILHVFQFFVGVVFF